MAEKDQRSPMATCMMERQREEEEDDACWSCKDGTSWKRNGRTRPGPLKDTSPEPMESPRLVPGAGRVLARLSEGEAHKFISALHPLTMRWEREPLECPYPAIQLCPEAPTILGPEITCTAHTDYHRGENPPTQRKEMKRKKYPPLQQTQ
ncbi:unnamed protein product [Pleuronectes platessa]|uniref:Uncharacterized protein n=1 Tax=Pleuronectes platessa TaxID=8262 RepID=A0A9N7VRZ7_PLEPL|nr:unnamed protein product [Pleuronectes platessa]